jgi:5-(hydroxymethyl)furfural/furfural oxidase
MHKPEESAVQFDVVIVGGGSAGCVLAGRLSADPQLKVALVEAGPDTPPGNVPDVIADSYPGLAYFDPRFHWRDLRVYTRSPNSNQPGVKDSKLEQARVMGGGSSINGQFAVRGYAADYDEWGAMGLAGWDHAGMLPYLKRLERDQDFPGGPHGADGPLPIRRIFPEQWAGYSGAMSDAMRAAGFPYHDDLNGNELDGIFPLPLVNENDRRVSTAMAYLDAAARARPNLKIFAETEVEALRWEGRKVTGVTVRRHGESRVINAGEVVISAGALHSPALLMRNGVGAAGHLRDKGVQVVADLPGVGENLMDHPHISVGTFLAPAARLPASQRRHIFFGLRYSSGLEGGTPGDMLMMPANRTGWHPLGMRIGSLGVCVNKSFSRGVVRLASKDPRREPFVDINMLSDGRDLARLVDAFKRIYRLMESEPVRSVTNGWFLAGYTDEVRALQVKSLANWFKVIGAATLMDMSPATRAWLYRYRFGSAEKLHRMAKDDQAIEEWVKSSVWSGWHVSGTCRMGPDGDPLAVLDDRLRVRGVSGLRVVDASVMPTIVRANTNISTIALAEKASDIIIDDSRRNRKGGQHA